MVLSLLRRRSLSDSSDNRAGRSGTAQKAAVALPACRFMPLTTAHLDLAAVLWAQARCGGASTASDSARDGNVVLLKHRA